MPPWSQVIQLSWHAELRFFESRTQLLRAFEEKLQLAAFRWDNGTVSARLGRSELVEVWSTGCMLLLATPEGDSAVGRKALELVLAVINPTRVQVQEALFQFLTPIDDEYDTVRLETARQVFGDFVPSTTLHDWSVLLDGRSEELGVPYAVEFGIINENEASDRVSRRVGRIHHGAVAPVPSDFWRLEEAPSCALFMDWRWMPPERVGMVDGLEALCELWNGLVIESDRIATSLQQKFSAGGAEMVQNREQV